MKSVFISYFLFIRLPVALILRFLSLFSRKLRNRVSFEKSFFIGAREDKRKATHAFHVSSQGELEQCFPLIEHALSKSSDGLVEVIFTSESVAQNLINLSEKFPNRLKCFPLPLTSLNPIIFASLSKNISSDMLIMCRYDFFPELIYQRFSKVLLLVSARVKNKGLPYLKVLSFFHGIVASSKDCAEKMDLSGLNIIDCADFRAMRISKRQQSFVKNQEFNKFKSLCLGWKGSVVCFGSTWGSDLKMIRGEEALSEENIYFFFPHKLTEISVQEHLNNLPSNTNVVDDLDNFNFDESIMRGDRFFIIRQMGVLCDVYPFFDYVYVGGGFGESIHSVLEPYVSGANVFCGPKVDRSSEYEFIKNRDPEKIQIIKSLFEIKNFLASSRKGSRGKERLSFIKSFEQEHLISIDRVLNYEN